MGLIVTSSLSLADNEKTWRQMSYIAFVSFILLTVLSLILVFQLIKRQREREEEQQRAILQQKHEAVARTTSGLAHDFNNLLSATQSGLNLALKNADDPNKVRTYIAAAQEVIQRGGKLTHLLLNFAKRQQGDVSSADLNILLQELRPILSQAAGPGIQINVNPTPGLPSCRIDRTQFESAILNLAINSRDAMPKGGTITIQTRVEPHSNIGPKLKPGAYVTVQVKDNGPGMPPEIARRAFEPFFTTKGEKGTGLGLAQVYRFMRQIGGDATLMSRLGQGTSIELYFPCEEVDLP
jgi:signal transduction histidine kinase